jgi:hypothetical protein
MMSNMYHFHDAKCKYCRALLFISCELWVNIKQLLVHLVVSFPFTELLLELDDLIHMMIEDLA